jgi:hypothetical protein
VLLTLFFNYDIKQLLVDKEALAENIFVTLAVGEMLGNVYELKNPVPHST